LSGIAGQGILFIPDGQRGRGFVRDFGSSAIGNSRRFSRSKTAMNSPTSNNNLERSGQYPKAHDSADSVETFPLHSKHPGQVGLANEARPGLGSRTPWREDEGEPLVEIDVADVAGLQSVVPRPPERRHEPAEQDSGSLAQQLERETGVSGHSGGT
jgi:hypothetical protein